MSGESQNALLRLFAEQRSRLEGFFLRRVAHAWDAQDLRQELYLRLWHAAGQREETIRNPEAYLYTVASNLVREHSQARARVLGGDALESVIERLATPCQAADDVDRQRRRERLAQLLERLTPRAHAVLVMRYRDEMDYQQIGQALGISTHMVKKQVVKALAVCRQGMARYE